MSSIYTILENLNKVTVKQEPQENKKSQPVYESVEAKGSILKGVTTVEQKLREQFAAMKEASYVHKGTYGTEYQGDPDDADAPKRGRPAKGTAKKEKVIRVKGPKGRPKKDPAASAPANIGNDPFGRVPDKAPKGAKGTVVKGKGNIDTVDEAAKYRDAKYKDQLYTQEPRSAEDDYYDLDYYTGAKPDDYAGAKRIKGGGEFDHNDPLQKGFGRHGHDTLERGPRKGMPSRDHITSLKGSIKAAHGTHAEPTLPEGAKNPYAIGMAQAKKETGLGRATAKNLPKSTVKRAHHIGKTIKANESSLRMAKLLIEGVNFTEMIKKKDITLQEMLAELQNDIQTFKETGHCSELLRDCMEVHSFNKQQLNDAVMDESPVFSMAADRQKRGEFPAPLPQDNKPSMMDRAKAFGGHVLNKLGHGSDEDMKADLRRKMGMKEAAELNELARLAGLTVKEGNDGKHEVDESDDDDDGNMHMADVLRGIAQKFAQKAHQGDDGQFWTDQAGIVMKASRTIDQQGMEAGMQVLNTCDCWDALGDELELHDIEVQDLVNQYGLDQHAAGDYRNFGSDYDGANEDPHGWDDEMEEGAEASGFYVNHEMRTGDPERVAGPFTSQQEAQAWINDNVPNPSDEPYYNISQVGFNEDDEEPWHGIHNPETLQDLIADAQSMDYDDFHDTHSSLLNDPREFWDHYHDGMEEGAGVMHFKAEKAKEAGKDHFNMGGEEFPVQEGETCPTCHSEPCCCEDMEEADRELAKLKENCGIVSPIGSMAQDMQQQQQQQGKLSINTSQSTDGTKNINISADGEAADQLMQILKMAGMASGQQAEVVVTAQPMEAKEYGNTDVEEPEEVLNTPRPRVKGMHSAETVGFANTSDDLHKQKGQHPKTAAKGDNPLATHRHHEETLESANPLDALGAKLMAEYQAIKITK